MFRAIWCWFRDLLSGGPPRVLRPKNNKYCTLKVDRYGTHVWRNASDQYHRVDADGNQDGPALIYPDGYQVWYLNGKRHRLDGPACIWDNGDQLWFLDNNWVTQEGWTQDTRVIEYNSRTQEGAEEWLRHL